MKYARIINLIAVDVVTQDPTLLFHPEIAAEFVAVPENIEDGWMHDLENDTWTAPPAPLVVAEAAVPVIRFSYPHAAEKETDITVNVSVVNPADNSPVPVNNTYYVPLMNVITGAMDQMLVVPIIDGVGHVTFSVPTPGRYSIKTDLILPKPTAQLSETPDIAIY